MTDNPDGLLASLATEQADQFFRVLVDPMRRALITRVAASDQPISRDQLVDALGKESTETADGSLSAETRDRLHLMLHHAHLPALIDAELLAERADSYELTDRGHAAASIIAELRESASDERKGYVG